MEVHTKQARDGKLSGYATEIPKRAERRLGELMVDNLKGEPVCAAPCHFVPSGEEVTHALVDISVNRAECRSTRPVTEVVRPAEQRLVQRVAHFGPRIGVAGHQQITDLRLEPLHALLGWARAQIPLTITFVTVRSERVSQEVEAFLPSILQRGLGLVEGDPKPRHHRLRPRQSLSRTSATEDDEVVGVRNDVCAER